MNRKSSASLEADAEKSVREQYEPGLYDGDIIVRHEILDQWNRMSIEQKASFEKNLIWKLDMRLVPWLSLLYLLSFLDRTNIGNAKIQGVGSIVSFLMG